MDDSLADRYAKALGATLGHEDRMISFSKSGYRERHPLHVAIFNANVCVAAGRIWRGDLDLTLSEAQVAALSARTDETVYVFYEHDVPRLDEQPSLDTAIYSVTSTGHTTFEHAHVERTKEGTLQLRPPEPATSRRWRWRVLRHRPRLWRFWRLDRRGWQEGSLDKTTLLYVGDRGDSGPAEQPLLVLFILRRGGHLPRLAFEITWYPSHNLKRCAPRPLLNARSGTVLGRLELWLVMLVWPGFTYTVRVGFAFRPRWR